MKQNFQITLLLATLVLFSGCNEDEEVDPTNIFTLAKTGGDMQLGNPYQALLIPVRILVTNGANANVPDVSISYEVTQGEGTTSTAETTTNNLGRAEVLWTLGGPNELQELTVSARYANGSHIENSPQTFTATFGEACLSSTLEVDVVLNATEVEAVITGGTEPYTILWSNGQTTNTAQFASSGLYQVAVSDWAGCTALATFDFLPGCGGNTEVTDSDGNVYEIVDIGTQCWTTKNLRTTKYLNGESITPITDQSQWASATTGAWCAYDNDPSNEAIYGKLYNWIAVNDNRKLCPTGWHMPTDSDWSELAATLGGADIAGGKMKATGLELWANPNSGATNESGFSALPGSLRDSTGTFHDLGKYAIWWTATSLTENSAWLRYTYYNAPNMNRFGNNKKNGLAVRCVKD